MIWLQQDEPQQNRVHIYGIYGTKDKNSPINPFWIGIVFEDIALK